MTTMFKCEACGHNIFIRTKGLLLSVCQKSAKHLTLSGLSENDTIIRRVCK